MENTKLRHVKSKICVRNSQADVGQDRREKYFFPRILESFKKELYQIGSIGDRSGKVWLGSSGTSNVWPSIVTGLNGYNFFSSMLFYGQRVTF